MSDPRLVKIIQLHLRTIRALCLFVISVIYYFGFEILVLIVSVPGHCISSTFDVVDNYVKIIVMAFLILLLIACFCKSVHPESTGHEMVVKDCSFAFRVCRLTSGALLKSFLNIYKVSIKFCSPWHTPLKVLQRSGSHTQSHMRNGYHWSYVV